MREQDERKLTVIDGTKTEEMNEAVKKVSRQTNPIMKQLLEFHNDNSKKFSVKDLFKK